MSVSCIDAHDAPYWWRATSGFPALALAHLALHRTLHFYCSNSLMSPRVQVAISRKAWCTPTCPPLYCEGQAVDAGLLTSPTSI